MSKTKQRQQSVVNTVIAGVDRKVAGVFKDIQGVLDRFAQEIQTIYQNQVMMSESMDKMDIMLVVLRSVLVKKGLTTNEEFDEEIAKVMAIKLKMYEERRQATESLAEITPEGVTTTGDIDPELLRMKDAAEEAGKEGTPEDAFIFGG
jgi:hypothetical protein